MDIGWDEMDQTGHRFKRPLARFVNRNDHFRLELDLMKKPVAKVALSVISHVGLEDRLLLSSMSYGFPDDHGGKPAIEMSRMGSHFGFDPGRIESSSGEGPGNFAADMAMHGRLESPAFLIIPRPVFSSEPPDFLRPGKSISLPEPGITTDPDPSATVPAKPVTLPASPSEPPAKPVVPPIPKSIVPAGNQSPVRATSLLNSSVNSFYSTGSTPVARSSGEAATDAAPQARRDEPRPPAGPIVIWHTPATEPSQALAAKTVTADPTRPSIADVQPVSPAQGQGAAIALSPWESLKKWLARDSASSPSAIAADTETAQAGNHESDLATANLLASAATASGAMASAPTDGLLLFPSLNQPALALADAQLLQETAVEDQSDLIQQSIDAILAELTPTNMMQGTSRTGVGTSLGLAVATALTVEYLRRTQKDDQPEPETQPAQKFKPECEESESID